MKDIKLTITSIKYLVQELTKLVAENKNKTYRVSIKEWREKRSLDQNSTYWLWLNEINRQAPLKIEHSNVKGAELWHEVFKKYYCPVKNITNGEKNLPVKSTKLLDVGEMTYYLERIENWCIDRGITLPISEDSDYFKLIQKQVK